MRMMLAGLVLLMAAPAAGDDWTTFYESSDKKRTPNYEQTVEYCKRLADASPWVHYTSFGTSPQGRDLSLVIVDRKGRTTAAEPEDGIVVEILRVSQPSALVEVVPGRAADRVVLGRPRHLRQELRDDVAVGRLLDVLAVGPPAEVVRPDEVLVGAVE